LAAVEVPFRIEPLSDRHNRAELSSGVSSLDRYFHLQAGQDVRRRIASCFVLTDDGVRPVGYYTLSATGIDVARFPAAISKRLPSYPVVPAVLMGRLAIDSRYRGQGFGEALLFDAFRRSLRSEIAVFAFVVDPKDEAAEAFYARYRFIRLPDSGSRMFLPLAEIAKLFA
jgi:GNAT superfamily N-acetyltransferase